ncbi:hypothetical protein Q3G72_024140 [Acer saccharum]|nr:hypothetical protein Q3G72_024140 [Acer saccharum]
MAQYNLISSCLRNVQSICNGIHSLPWIGELVDKYHCLTRKDVDVYLQDIIFKQLQQKSNEIEDARFSISCKKLLAQRGDNVLEKRYNLPDISGWSINDVDFDHSLLLWHIATDLCYASDGNDDKVVPKMAECRISKYLSDYMLYLLVFCPSMLQEGIAEIRYRDTLAECKRFFPEEKIRYWKFVLKRKQSIEKIEACKKLLGVKFGDEQEHIKGDQSQSVLFYGCRLAKQLQDLETQDGWSRERKWKMISEVWVEMLTYAANKCIWKEHGQQLRRGGELLTHVRLLMMISLSASTNKLTNIQNRAEEYAKLIMEVLDTDKVGYAMVNKLETLLLQSPNKYEKVLSNEHMPTQENNPLERCYQKVKYFLINHWQKVWILMLWLGIVSGLFAYKFVQYRNKAAYDVMGYCVCIAKGAAETLKFNMALILLPVCRITITWLRNHTRLRGVVPFDNNLDFHTVITRSQNPLLI